MKRWMQKLIVVSLLGVLGATGAWAQTTNYWTNTLGGAWSTAGNWDPNSVPAANNAWVLFTNNASSAYTVDLSGGYATSGQFRVSSDKIVIDPQGNRWYAYAPADGGVGTLGHWIGRDPGSTATVTFSSSVAPIVPAVNFNATDNCTTVIGTNDGLTVINIDTSLGNGMRVQMSKNVMIYNPSSAATNVIVNIDGAGAEWYVAGNNASGYNGIWNVTNGGKLTEGQYGLSIGGGSSPAKAGYAMMTFDNSTLATAQGGLYYLTYVNQAFAEGHVRLYNNSVWTADGIYIGRYSGTGTVLVDDSAIYATDITVGGDDPTWSDAVRGVGSLTIQNGSTVVASNGYFVVNASPAGKTNLLVLNGSTIKLGTPGVAGGVLTNRGIMRASGTITGLGSSPALVYSGPKGPGTGAVFEVGSSLGTLTLDNANLELAAGSKTLWEFSDTGLDQIIVNGGSASVFGSNVFSLAAGSAPLAPGYKWGLGTYDFLVASNITWNAQYYNLTSMLASAGLVQGLDYQLGLTGVGGGLQALRLEFVPEPSTVMLLVGGGLLLWRSRRRNT